MSCIDHIALFSPTSLIEQEVTFFKAALGPFGQGEQFRVMPTVIALGTKEKPWLWLSNLDSQRQEIKEKENVQGVHLALSAKSRQEVENFYRAALAAGGKDNGPPGIRKEYHGNYYATFVISPTGHNIEAVDHTPEA